MKGKAMSFLGLGLAVTMLFFALPKLGSASTALGNYFWIAWTVVAALAIAANGNIILMTEEKRERLLVLKRHRALRLERKLSAMASKQTVSKKTGVKETA